ncbi:MAG: H(+)/Cl(-) exchange transporter ClcA [Fimbriimonadaceae bacterium]|nr:H(+)/Cl(-) exchange transporter ClcA [Fimbriimonadaceae bacterium]
MPSPKATDSSSEQATRWRLLSRLDRRRTLLLAGVVGVIAGLVAVAFRYIIVATEHASLYFAKALDTSNLFILLGILVAGTALGGLAGWVTERFCPEAAGSGIPQTKLAILGIRPLRSVRVLLVKLVGGVLALASGMSLGREGPTIHMAAASGELFGRLVKAPRRSRRALLASGAGAGLAAAFNAPLAGFLFVMEELKREMSPITYGTALIASVSSVAVARFAIGQESSFLLRETPIIPLRSLWIVVVVGIVAGLIGILFNRMLLRGMDVRKKFRIPRWLAGGIVGGFASLMLALYPRIAGGGHTVAESVLRGGFDNIALLALATILIGKLLMTIASYSTGVPGGIFAPLLVIGSLAGLLIALTLQTLGVDIQTPPEVYATIGMAAVLSSSVRAPLTGVVLVVEMTSQYTLLYALLIGAFVAYAAAELFHDKPIYEALMERQLETESIDHDHDGEVVEFAIEPGSIYEGSRVDSLGLQKGILIAAVERDGRVLAPHGKTVLLAGDMVTFVLSAGLPPTLLAEAMEHAKAP